MLDQDLSLSSSDESFPGKNRPRPAPPRGRSKHKGNRKITWTQIHLKHQNIIYQKSQ